MADAASVRRGEARRDLGPHPKRSRDVDGAAREPVLERLALHELEDEEAGPVLRLLEAVDGADIRMVERGEEPGLGLEAAKRAFVARELVRQPLDRDGALELGVEAEVDDAHAPAPELALDGIATDASGSGGQGGSSPAQRYGKLPTTGRAMGAPPALHTDEGRAERRGEPSRDVDAKRGPGLAARTPRGGNYLAEAHFGGVGTRPLTCADSLPEQSTAYVSKSPLPLIFQSTSPEPGVIDGVAPFACVYLIVVPGSNGPNTVPEPRSFT